MTRSRTKTVVKWIVLLAAVAGGVAFFVLRQSASGTPVVFKTGKIDRGSVEQIIDPPPAN